MTITHLHLLEHTYIYLSFSEILKGLTTKTLVLLELKINYVLLLLSDNYIYFFCCKFINSFPGDDMYSLNLCIQMFT